jgi:uncharacterized SAM-dependent methyltransferase
MSLASVNYPNIRILLNELQVESESFAFIPLFQINISQEIYNLNVQNLLSTYGKFTIQELQRETSEYLNSNSRKTQNNYQLFV